MSRSRRAAFVSLAACLLACGAAPAEPLRTPLARSAAGVMVRELPWPIADPELAGPGAIHYAIVASWDLYLEAGGREDEGEPPFSVLALTTAGVAMAIESPRPRALSFHADRDGWLFAVPTEVPDRLSIVRVDRTGAVVSAEAFEGPRDPVTPAALGSRSIVVRRPLEYPGGGGGLQVQLGPSYPTDLVDIWWCEPDCHTPLALVTRGDELLVLLALDGEDRTTIRLGTVTPAGVSGGEPLPATAAPRAGCENTIFVHDGDTARARLPSRATSAASDVAIEGARWLPGPNTHPHDLDVCVEDGVLRVRAPGGEWAEVGERVDPERVWVSCAGTACVAVLQRVDGYDFFARFAL